MCSVLVIRHDKGHAQNVPNMWAHVVQDMNNRL